jgi:hypothetical protein
MNESDAPDGGTDRREGSHGGVPARGGRAVGAPGRGEGQGGEKEVPGHGRELNPNPGVGQSRNGIALDLARSIWEDTRFDFERMKSVTETSVAARGPIPQGLGDRRLRWVITAGSRPW